MTLRTSRRRVSSRTKQRYKIIKKFIRKAIGPASQTERKIHSTTELKLSVCDLKHKIFGIESQLDKISKHCSDLRCSENNCKKQPKKSNYHEEMGNGDEKSYDSLKIMNTKVLYEANNSKFKKSDESGEISTGYCYENENNMTTTKAYQCRDATDYRRRGGDRRKNDYTKKKSSPYLTTNNLSPNNQDTIFRHSNAKAKYFNKNNNCAADKHTNHDNNKSKRARSELDPGFITDIITKQYKPVKLYGRRESEFTQFSAPVCRDREFSVQDKVHHGNDLCSCCFEQCKKRDIADMGSVCDTRLYSSKKRNRYSYDKHPFNDYNNSAYYDIVPVKENSSPKARKKKFEYNTNAYYNYIEVPPSPRTQRPRLNLRAGPYNEYGELKKCSPNRHKSRDEVHTEDANSSQISINDKIERKEIKKKHKPLHLLNANDKDVNNFSKKDTTLISQTTNWSANNTDKALGEIKDILKTFLTVIKNESIHNASNQQNNTTTTENSQGFLNTGEYNANTASNGQSTNVGQCNPPFLPFIPNTCCYPIMPVCPVNYLQSGCIFPSASQTCHGCPKASKVIKKSFSTCNTKQEEVNTSLETRQMIKEIHKYITRSPKLTRDKDTCSDITNVVKKFEKKFVTKSVGDSSVATEFNINLGRAPMRCISRSCEAIFSTKDSYQTNASNSATIIDKVSIEATPSSTQSEVSTETSPRQNKKNKIKKMLTTWKLWGKKKNDIVDELSESETTVEVAVKPKSPPFKQNITNYAMHDQEYYNPPPIQMRRPVIINKSKFPQRQGYSKLDHSSGVPTYDKHQGRVSYPYTQPISAEHPYYSYDPNYYHMPQVPLCLKEIEVKSTATQSERKMSLIRKLTQKAKREMGKDASQQYNSPIEKSKLGLFNWKNLQENAKKNPIATDFTLKTKKELGQGDNKMRNAMIKKLFYKRNPFSPRNLIVRTLLGKDESSFGNPPKFYKPKLFI